MACPACSPELAPTGERRHGEHFAVRFGHWDRLVFKGAEKILDSYEVDVREGRAWRYVRPVRPCECGEGAAAYIDTGHFVVRRSEILTAMFRHVRGKP